MTDDGTDIPTGRIEIRVRYAECDPMGVAHHTAYPVWFEMGRTEFLRQGSGVRYRDLEAEEIYFAVAKLAVNGITQSLANELGWRKIRINAIAPGPTETSALEEMAGDYAREMVKSMPIKRLGKPEELASAALFLLSDEASWITGHILNVDGGQFMRP